MSGCARSRTGWWMPGLLALAMVPTAVGCGKNSNGAAARRGPGGARRSPYYQPGLVSGPTVTVTQRYGGTSGSGPRGAVAAYEIDRAPVSQGQYAAWLATRPDPGKQAGPCRGNASFVPEAACAPKYPACKGAHCPVACVDWCDARAYCEAVGKHLCGRIGGGPSPWRRYQDPRVSQWYNACESQNHRQAPRLTYAGVWEWEDSCDGDAAASRCRTRPMSRGLPGRHDAVGAAYHNCGAANAYGRQAHWAHVGFRCCRSR